MWKWSFQMTCLHPKHLSITVIKRLFFSYQCSDFLVWVLLWLKSRTSPMLGTTPSLSSIFRPSSCIFWTIWLSSFSLPPFSFLPNFSMIKERKKKRESRVYLIYRYTDKERKRNITVSSYMEKDLHIFIYNLSVYVYTATYLQYVLTSNY